MRRWKRLAEAMAVLLAANVAAGLWKGCAAVERPPSLTRDELAVIATGEHFAVSVEVEPYQSPPVYAEVLRDRLRATGLFMRVEGKGVLPAPDLVARVEAGIYGEPVIPIYTGLSLGFVPTITTESHGVVFSLRSARKPGGLVEVSYVHRGRTVLGWCAGFLNMTNGWTQNLEQDPRFADRLRLALLLQRKEIDALGE